MVCADTSFLFSLYGHDSHSAEALDRVSEIARPLHLSALNHYELGNAVRFAECRGFAPPGSAEQALGALGADIRAGRILPTPVSLEEIVAAAAALSARHTPKGGHRAFDILHVAHAQVAGATRFLSFDANQLKLAQACQFST